MGSCASGLALHNAPVDIVVTGLLAPDSCCGTGAESGRHMYVAHHCRVVSDRDVCGCRHPSSMLTSLAACLQSRPSSHMIWHLKCCSSAPEVLVGAVLCRLALFCVKLTALTTAEYTEMTKVLVNRHLAALAAALQRRGLVRSMTHDRRARMPRLDVSDLHLRRSAQCTYREV